MSLRSDLLTTLAVWAACSACSELAPQAFPLPSIPLPCSIILGKEAGFEARFEQWDYAKVARWTDADVAAALADTGIVRNAAKVRAAVANAAAALALDAAVPGGFEAFCWATCGRLPDAERLLQHGSRSGSHMRASERTDFETADGVHPTPGIAAAVAAFKARGFRFLGPATMLSFAQAAGFVNHHKPDCAVFAEAEAAHAQYAAQVATASASATGASVPIPAGASGPALAPSVRELTRSTGSGRVKPPPASGRAGSSRSSGRGAAAAAGEDLKLCAGSSESAPRTSGKRPRGRG